MTPTTTVDHQTTSKRQSSPKQQFRHHGDGTVFVTSLRHQLQFLTKPNVVPQKPPAFLEVSTKQLPVLFTYDFSTYESERGLGVLRNEPGLAHLKA